MSFEPEPAAAIVGEDDAAGYAQHHHDSAQNLLYLALLALSAITVFRRELSPNHRFAEEAQAAAVAVAEQEQHQIQNHNAHRTDSGSDGTAANFSHLHAQQEEGKDRQGRVEERLGGGEPSLLVASQFILASDEERRNGTMDHLDDGIGWKDIETVLDGTGLLGAPLLAVWMQLLALKAARGGGKKRSRGSSIDDNDNEEEGNEELEGTTDGVKSYSSSGSSSGRGNNGCNSDEGEPPSDDQGRHPNRRRQRQGNTKDDNYDSGGGSGGGDNSRNNGKPVPALHVLPGENLWKVLPNDVQVQALSFLHPRDVMSFGCASRSICRSVKDSSSLWKRLWLRDYGWAMTCWEPGRQALERSRVSLQDFEGYSARFYACFAACYLNYVLASHNTQASCLIGLGGNVYDLTSFLPVHPGGLETTLVNSGRDGTDFFAGIRHSFTAQKLAQKLCVLVDMTRLPPAEGGAGDAHPGRGRQRRRNHAAGLRPTTHTRLVNSPYVDVERQPKAQAPASTDFAPSRANDNGGGTSAAVMALASEAFAAANERGGRGVGPHVPASVTSLSELRQVLRCQEVTAKEIVLLRYRHLSPLQDCHVFLDPFSGRWKAWYTDFDFNPVFVDL
jgi:hypothetical protein